MWTKQIHFCVDTLKSEGLQMYVFACLQLDFASFHTKSLSQLNHTPQISLNFLLLLIYSTTKSIT